MISAPSRPTRTLTFLFADLRDYTRFVETHGDAAGRELISEYRQLVRNALERSGGGEIKTEGDSFYLVFATAGEALGCAAEILGAADRHNNERRDLPIRVGIGVHAGEPVPHEGQYVGSAVNVAARLAQAAGGGELLASDTVRGLVRTSGSYAMEERAGVSLKGIADAPRVYLVQWRTGRGAEGTHGINPSGQSATVPLDAPDRRLLFRSVVGRESELATLEAFAHDAAAGRGRVVLLAGDAGVGKSAFLRRFADMTGGGRFCIGQCNEIDARVSFGPFIEAMRSLLHGLSATTNEALRSDVSKLLGLFPGAGGSTIDALGEVNRYRAHAAFVRVLADAAEQAPLTIVIEDLHWADQATLELVPYLARKVADLRLLVIASYRTDDLHRTHPLRHTLAELSRARLAEEIRLRPLTRAEIATAVGDALRIGRPPSDEFLEALYSPAEGNPLIVEEILRSLIDRGELALRDGAWRRTRAVSAIQIPETLREAVRERFHALDEPTKDVLRYAAVIGQPASFELLRELTGTDERALVRSLRAALDGQLLVEKAGDGDEETYAFRHALTRESVLGELLGRERRLLHRAVAEALERTPAADASAQAEALAYHFDEAHDGEKALRYHDVAAREAQRALAHPRTRAHLERALELVSAEDPRLASLHRRLAQVAETLGDLPAAERSAEAAYSGFAANGNDLAAAEAAAFTSRVAWTLGKGEKADELGRKAVSLAEPFGDTRELGFAVAAVARNAMVNGRTDEAKSWSERGIRVARAVDDSALLADLNATLGSALPQHGALEEGLALLRDAISLGEAEGAHEAVSRAYMNSCVWLWIYRGAAAARETYEEGRQWAVKHDRQKATQLSFIGGLLAFAEPDWQELARIAGPLDRRNIYAANVQILQATALLATEGPAAANEALEGALPTIERATGWLSPHGYSRIAKLRWLAGDYEAVLDNAPHTFERAGLAQPGWVVAVVAWAARELGQPMAAERFFDHESTLTGAIVVSGSRTFAAAHRLDRRGQFAEAARAYIESAAVFDAIADPIQATAARLFAADALHTLGETDGAREAYRGGRAYWEKAGARWYLSVLDEWALARKLLMP